MATAKKPVKPVAVAKVEAPKVAESAAKKVETPAAEIKTEVKAVKPVVKAEAPAAKAEPAAKKETVKKEAVKKETKAVAKKAPAKKAPAKKAPAKKAPTKKAELKSEVHVEFSGKSYTQEELVKIAKDVWKYDLKQKASDLTSVKLYIKPEESLAYYVMNEEHTGSFVI